MASDPRTTTCRSTRTRTSTFRSGCIDHHTCQPNPGFIDRREMKGLGFLFCGAMWSSIAATRSAALVNTPPRSRSVVMSRRLFQPCLDHWGLVGSEVVCDRMHGFVLGRFTADLAQEL